MENLNYLFNKKYYQCKSGEEEKHFKECNKKLVNALLIKEDSLKGLIKEDECFELKTSYPGLLIGIGNVHESGIGDNEIKLGFYLDYVTGMPSILGSTVKGTLRSAFKMYPEFVGDILGIDDIESVKEMEKEIFDNGDVFFDAIITHGKQKEDGEKILDLDNITPHLEELKDPNPLTMLRIRPDVTFKFRFKLKNSTIDKGKKLELFKELLMNLGIGAKTNTGYGYLTE